MTLSAEAFIEQFERQALPPELFDHCGHLRLAWLYLNQYSLPVAIDKVASGISAYANSLGATDKFKYTVTEAIVRIMATRMKSGQASTFEAFLAQNSDLVSDMEGVLSNYYSKDHLNNERARVEYLSPDLAPLDALPSP